MAEVAQQNDLYQVRIKGRIDGQETNNVLVFRCVSGAGDSDVLVHLIQVLATCFVTHLLPVLSSAFTLEQIIWKRVSPTLGPEIVSIPTGFGAAGQAGEQLPSFTSAVISIRSSLGGRSHRGRMYVPGAPLTAVNGSSWDPGNAFWLGLVAFAACLVTNFIPGDPPGNNAWAMGIYSRKIGGSTFPYSLSGFTPMKEALPQALVGTTRSRKVGRGS